MSRTPARPGLGSISSRPAAKRQQPRKAAAEPLESRLVMTTPTFATPLPSAVDVVAGVPLNIALDGFDADGGTLTFTAAITAGDPNKLQAIIPTGNQSLRFHISHTASSDPADVSFTGTLIGQLFEDLAPRTTAEIIERVEADYYDGKIFHRIIPGFVTQGGSLNGNGNGGAGSEFDDEYNADLRHSSAGVFSMAKAVDDGNDAQFFITLAATRGLDFQHSVFGFQTEISPSINFLVPRNGEKPKSDITITDVEVFTDLENGVLRLKAPKGVTGDVSVTVTVSDGTTSFSSVIQVHIVADTVTNTPPHFADIPPIHTNANQPVTVTLPIIDLENNAFEIVGTKFSNDIGVTFGKSTGSVTITPKAGFFGVDAVLFYVSLPNAFTSTKPLEERVLEIEPFVDRQLITVLVDPPAPTVELLTDTGGVDGVTNANNSAGHPLRFRVSGVSIGNKVDLRDGAGNLLASVPSATSTTINFDFPASKIFPDGPLTVRATQTFHDTLATEEPQEFDLESDPGSLTISIDTSNSPFDSEPVLEAFGNVDYAYEAHSVGDGQPFSSYSLVTKPVGMAIDAITGAITWKPTLAQANSNPVVVQFIDGVGNVSTQSFTIGVHVPPVLDFISNKTGTEGTSLTFKATASDANQGTNGIGDSLLFGFLGQPTGASINPQTGDVIIIPNESFGGQTIKITVLVRDSRGLLDSQEVLITWDEDNQAPVIDDVEDLSVIRGGQVSTSLIATDPDAPARALAFSIDPSNTTPGASISAGGAFLFQAGTLAAGAYDVVVRVTESGANPLSATKTIHVNVVANGPPVIDPITPKSVHQGETLQFDVVAHDPDQPPRTLIYTLDPSSPVGASINASTGRLTFTPAADFTLGELSIKVIVTEQGTAAESSERSFNVTVLESINEPPTVQPIADQSIAQRKALFLQVAASDPEGQRALAYALTGTIPPGASINETTGAFTFTPADGFPLGPVTINVLVTEVGANPKSTSVSFDVNVTDNPNKPPSIGAIGDRSVQAGQATSFGIPAADVDDPASTLVYSLSGAAIPGASIDPATGLFTFAPGAGFPLGPVTFNVLVTEVGGNPLSATASFTVEVTAVPPVNQPPEIGDAGDHEVVAGATISFTIPATDPDTPPSALVYSLIDADVPGASIDPNTGLFTFTPPAGALPGDYSFTVRVEEKGGGLASEATFAISVSQSFPGLDSFRFLGFQLDSRGTTVVNLARPSLPTIPGFFPPVGSLLPGSFAAQQNSGSPGASVSTATALLEREFRVGPATGVPRVVDPNTLPGNQQENPDNDQPTGGNAPGDSGVVPASNEEPAASPAEGEQSKGDAAHNGLVSPAAAAAALDEVSMDWLEPSAWTRAHSQDTVGRWAEETFGIGEAVGRFDPDMLDLDLQMGAPTAGHASRPLRLGPLASVSQDAGLHSASMAAEIAAAVRRMAEARQAEQADTDDMDDADAFDDEPGDMTIAAAAALGFYMPLLVTDIAEPVSIKQKKRRKP